MIIWGKMNTEKRQIQQMVNRETHAWDEKDAETLVSIFHPDMVWPWPKNEHAHNPVDWIFPFGKYNQKRWKDNWQNLFDTHELIHNNRKILKITISEQGDGAFAVVEIDTLWRDKKGEESHWKGTVGKGYTKTKDGWKLIMHTGVLKY